MKATDYPVKCVAPGVPANNAGNTVALKATLWRYYLRPFGFGETKLTLPDSTKKSTRSGFSSFLRYRNSPYIGHNGLYAPTEPKGSPHGLEWSDYTSDAWYPTLSSSRGLPPRTMTRTSP